MKAFPGIFIDNRKNPEYPSIHSCLCNKVIAPYMISIERTQSYAATVIEPEPFSFGLLLRHFQSFLSPDSFHPLMVHIKTFMLEHCCYPSVSVSSVFFRQFYDPFRYSLLLLWEGPYMPLC